MTYDERQAQAVLAFCRVCWRLYYMVVPRDTCRECSNKLLDI